MSRTAPGGFEAIRLDVTVARLRDVLAGGRIGVVVDDQGRAIVALRARDLVGHADSATASEVASGLPEGLRVFWDGEDPLTAAMAEVRARIVADGGRLDLPGVVVVDHAERPIAVIHRRTVLRALLGVAEGDGLRRATESDPVRDAARFGRLEIPSELAVDVPVTLAVSVCHRRGRPDDVELDVAPRSWPISLTVTLVDIRPADFVVWGPDAAVLRVPEHGDSEQLTFTLVPQSLGPKVVRVRFECDHEFLGMARVRTEVVCGATGGGATEVAPVPMQVHRAAAPDVTVHVVRDGSFGYSVRVRTRDDPAGTQPRLVDRVVLDRSPDEFVDDLYRDVMRAAGTQGFDRIVRRAGTALWDRLFGQPRARPGVAGFDAFYWGQLRPQSEDSDPARRWRTVQIVSDDPYIPWEILRPTRRLADGTWQEDPFLCERFDLARWLSDAPAAVAVPLRRMALVAPPSNLPWVSTEVEGIRRVVTDVVDITDREALDEFLRDGAADVLHFACHGRFGRADSARSVVWIGAQRFSPIDITGEYRNFGRYRPLVFLNACDTGRLGVGISGIEGWSREFLRSGASVFVGSLWATDDRAACRFAVAFYNRLAAGATVGEAARAGREAAVMPHDASHLGFTVFGNPCIRATGRTV